MQPKFRITVDLPLAEREALQALCDIDLRTAGEQIRWLVIIEARKRGIALLENYSSVGHVLADSNAAAVQLPTVLSPDKGKPAVAPG